jgi:hypothetical protein
MKANTTQFKHLRDRINVAANRASWYRRDLKGEKDPPDVQRARRLIKRFDAKKSVLQAKYQNRLESMKNKVQEALLFKTEAQALAATIRFEKDLAKFVKRT